MTELFTLKQASNWASKYLDKTISVSNISYLIQYGRVPKVGNKGSIFVKKADLINYYKKNSINKEQKWKKELGNDLNWKLSFSEFKEAQTTKHVHRLHPYKGKFIPQLVEYFLDEHTDEFKTNCFFHKGQTVLDPFCGSGTTLVQANELGLNAIGVDISEFNSHISNTKIGKYNLKELEKVVANINHSLIDFRKRKRTVEFEDVLQNELKIFNNMHFPSPDYKIKVRSKLIDEKEYARLKELDFLTIFNKLISSYNINLKQNKTDTFLDIWFINDVREEIDFVFNIIKQINDISTKRILSIILSRTMRSCRATTHADLGTLINPQLTTYYCKKHGKICKPIFTISSWFNRYAKDTIKRLAQFEKLRTNTSQICLTGDSRYLNIFDELEQKKFPVLNKLKSEKIDGIFSSPPYVGLIDYHEQHAYSYDLFGFSRNDNLEIGPLYKGQSKAAQKNYSENIAKVLINCKKYLKQDYNIFLVANDKYGLYPRITELAKMKIVNQFKRPVLNRVEKDRTKYSETIFHLKDGTKQ